MLYLANQFVRSTVALSLESVAGSALTAGKVMAHLQRTGSLLMTAYPRVLWASTSTYVTHLSGGGREKKKDRHQHYIETLSFTKYYQCYKPSERKKGFLKSIRKEMQTNFHVPVQLDSIRVILCSLNDGYHLSRTMAVKLFTATAFSL